MRSQYILILTIFILLALYSIALIKPQYNIYESNIVKYIAYNYWYQLKNNTNTTTQALINKSYEGLCNNIGLNCSYNGTYIKVISPTKIYILQVK